MSLDMHGCSTVVNLQVADCHTSVLVEPSLQLSSKHYPAEQCYKKGVVGATTPL